MHRDALCDELKLKTTDIHARAAALKTQLPAHLKMLPQIQQTLALIQDISEVLLCLTQQIDQRETTGGNPHGHHD